MIHFIRRQGKTLVDVEVTKNDLSSVVCIEQYSRFLLDTDDLFRQELVTDFDGLQELRGEWFEQPHQDETPNDLVERRLKEIGVKWSLDYVTD